MAAMIKRAGTPVLRLFEPSNDSIPDFEIETNSTPIAVEAKQLMDSEPQTQFYAYATNLQAQIEKRVFVGPENYPVIHLIIKDAEKLPPEDAVIGGLQDALGCYVGTSLIRRAPNFNVTLDPDPASEAFAEYRNLNILCPRSRKESLRVARRAEKSNKQLRNNTEYLRPGLLCLGITEHQDPHLVAKVLQNKFSGSQLRAVSGVILHSPGQHGGPDPRMVLDLLSFIPNKKAKTPAFPSIRLRPLGIGLDLLQNTPVNDIVSAYRMGKAQGKVKDVQQEARLDITVTRKLDPEILR
jgi:hypothetical protein|tara:strand:+ start:1809 stop:2696 length:888 start_codon:yes stop_codon:yes gene_type:complete